MKNILSKIVLIVTSVFALLGSVRRKSDEPTRDAIDMGKKGDPVIVEDYEMAAYHNHA
ncbi:MAG: hypothetical protein ACK5AO_04965 [bacterium]|jgi:hypothetical protein